MYSSATQAAADIVSVTVADEDKLPRSPSSSSTTLSSSNSSDDNSSKKKYRKKLKQLQKLKKKVVNSKGQSRRVVTFSEPDVNVKELQSQLNAVRLKVDLVCDRVDRIAQHLKSTSTPAPMRCSYCHR